MLLMDTEFVDPYCMGEAKEEEQAKSIHILLMGTMRNGLLSKGFINEISLSECTLGSCCQQKSASFPDKLSSYIQQFFEIKDAEVLYKAAIQSSFDLLEGYDKVWIRQAILKDAKMYILKKISFYDKYEESIIHKKWGFICLFSEGTHIETSW